MRTTTKQRLAAGRETLSQPQLALREEAELQRITGLVVLP
jgi:hypothetical protein